MISTLDATANSRPRCSLAMPLGHVHYAYSATLVTVVAPGPNTDQILIGLAQDSNNSYYCELFKSMVGTPAFGYTVDTAGTFARQDTDNISPPRSGRRDHVVR